ncbi:MAG: abortive infection protein [Conexibacter sp.]|nr:abortive infection protein [Conexibacter sp.]
MAFVWSDVEQDLERTAMPVYEAMRHAYRVEAVADQNSWGDHQTVYDLYFNGHDPAARAAARAVKDADRKIGAAIKAHVEVWDHRYTHNVRVLSPGREGDGVLCERLRPGLRGDGSAPLDGVVTTGTEHLDSSSVSTAWSKAIDRRTSDPSGAITAARSLLESTCKTILDDRGVTYSERGDLPALYKAVQKALKLAPSDHTEEQFRAILGACTTVVKELGSVRNRISDSHASGRKTYRPAPRHAALAVNLAGSMALFLMETHEARQ